MDPVFLTQLASRKTAWLAARQQAIASNIANQNMPGYQALDVVPFQDVLARTHLDLTATNAAHIAASNGTASAPMITEKDNLNEFEVTESGNTVGIEGEMAKSGEVNRDYSLTTNIVKSFHSMLMAALKE